MTTKDKILKTLRENPRTVSELAKEFGLARTAITTQLDRLSSDGLIEKGTMRSSSGAGKPAQEYKTVAGTEDFGSSAYLPFVTTLLEHLPKHLDNKQRKKLLQTVGKDMAEKAGLLSEKNKSKTLEEKIEAAIAVVNELGATAKLIDNENDITVRNVTCPLASAVRTEACVCDAVAAFFQEATGAKTKAACDRGENLVCRYVIKK
ncbi:MAG: ArsR family transcriptional regulator [Rhizobiales bacterium]|nr:ArsR family transcriptional regulator [Hyphomicrobiales bacterium]